MSARKWGGAPSEKCTKCGKTVYAAEMAKMENQIWHIECLRCVECNKKLAGSNWGGFVPPDNQPYCNVHHKRLLQSAGSAIEFSGSTTDSKWAIRVATEGAQGAGAAPVPEKKAVPADQACTKCGGRSYPAESVKMEGQLWHENCLRCVETGCGKKLNGSNWGGFVAPNNSPYCSVHLKRLVQSAGSSLETTGSTTGSKWNANQSGGGAGGATDSSSSAPTSTSAPAEGGEASSEDNESSGGDTGSGDSSAPSSTRSSGTAGAAGSAGASPASSGAKPKWGGAPSEKCVKCGKTVYSAEMAKMEGQIWHDNCLRCVEEGCNKKLSGSNWGGFVPPDNKPYCKVHHQRLLQSKGSSIEFSGSTASTSKWKINSGQ